MKVAEQAIYKSEFFDQYMSLINTCRNKQHKTNSTQIHHITPRSLGGDDNPDNLVELSPSDHVKAHELLFRHFVFCLQVAARSWASMAGKTGFYDENMIPDAYNAKMKDAYDIMRKRPVYSLKDMSERKIRFFDKTPEGFIELPKPPDGTKKRQTIFNPETSAVFRKWPKNAQCPDGWKTSSQLDADEKRAFISAISNTVYAYDPRTLEFGKFKLPDVPSGWIIYDISDPRRLLEENLRRIKTGAEKAANQAVRAVHLAMAAEIETEIKNAGTAVDPGRCELYGLYFRDGKYLTLCGWCRELGVPYTTAKHRMYVYGMPFEDAVRKLTAKEAVADLHARGFDVWVGRPVSREKAEAARKKTAASRLAKRKKKEAELVALLEEFNQLGWGGFVGVYGQKRGKSLYAKLKRVFGEKCRTRGRDCRPKKILYRGKVQSMTKWCEELGFSHWKVYALVNGGLSFQEAFDKLLGRS